jgi:hypothetical protein
MASTRKPSLPPLAAAKSVEAELRSRIDADADAFGGKLPDRYALAWSGYLAAVVEWRIIDVGAYGRLIMLLPPTGEPDPVMTMFTGRPDDGGPETSER